MAFPITLNNANTSHSAFQPITAADENVQSTDINAIGVKVGGDTSTPTAGTLLKGTGTGTSAWQAPLAVTAKSANYTLTSTDDVILATGGSGGITITLHSAASAVKKLYLIKKVDAGVGAITIGGTVDGVTNPTLTFRYDAILLVPDGTDWGAFG